MSDQPQDAARRALLQNALTTVDRLQAKLDAMERARREPIAIVGLSCRFPGAESPDAYWQLLENGVDAVREVPTDRWTPDAYADVDPVAAAEMPVQRGGFMPRIDLFDPYFFGISPREAIWMDPQQRMVLEVCWEALEDAGMAPTSLRGSQTGVFVGITAGDYGYHAMEAGRSRMGVHIVSGITPNAAAGRVAYLLGLHGPCMAIDTACSSSLTAIHVACQSLRAGESTLALAGGVHALIRHEHFVTFHKWGMIAPDGHCKTFDAAADGFVRGEGCGFLVLKRLRDALADGDRIHAVIRGSSINQDGASGGLTVPNGVAQQAVIRQALAAATVTSADLDYVEAHGTGTSLGDPIELEALDAAMGDGRPSDRPLVVGSVKTNIGHLEAAAGVASVIKVVLSLERERIPPHLHFKTLTPKATMRKLSLLVPTDVQPWQKSGRRRIAGVSGFGFSGTNVHLVIEEAPAPKAADIAATADRPAHVVTLSAKNEDALRELASRWHAQVSSRPDIDPADAGFTANAGRSHFAYRAALVAGTPEQLREQLAAVARGEAAEQAFTGGPQGRGREKVAFLFTGQGSQYARMGRALYETQPTFKQTLDECGRLLGPHMDRPLLEVLFEEGTALDQTIYTQPSLFSLEYALATLWRSWGVSPDFVLGHSVGEYVAACVAGVFSLEDALRLIATRARLMAALPSGGAMSAVLASEDRISDRVAPYSRTVSIAAVNAPDSVVISGDGGAVRAVAAELQQDGIVCRPLTVSHAFHSPLMDPMLDEFEAVARSVRYAAPQIGLISNLTGAVVEDDQIDAQYWRRHVREAVRFAAGMKTLHEQGCSIFIEIGPTPTLLALGRRSIADSGLLWVASQRRDQEWRELLSSVARLYCRGVDVDWRSFDRPYSRRKIALPTYPFQRQRYWLEPETESAKGAAGHPLLGSRIDTATGDVLFKSRLALDSAPFIADHVIAGTVLLPATAYIDLMLSAAREVLSGDRFEIVDFTIADPLAVPVEGHRELQLMLRPESEGVASIQVFSRAESGDDSTWKLHATARARQATGEERADPRAFNGARGRCRTPVSVDDHYARMRAQEIEFGPAFQCLASLSQGNGEALGEVVLAAKHAGAYLIHPVLLDACFQVLGASGPASQDDSTYLPIGIDRLWVADAARAAGLTHAWSHARLRGAVTSAEALTADVTIFDENGDPVAGVEGLRLKRASRESLRRAAHVNALDWVYEITWKPATPAAEAPRDAVRGRWLILGDDVATADALEARLRSAGGTAVIAIRGAAFERLSAARYAVNAESASDLERLLSEAPSDLSGVLHLWSADATGSGIEDDARHACGAVLLVAQALLKRDTSVRPELWIATRGAQPVTSQDVSPAQSAVWGLARTIRAEQPDLRCVSVDLDRSASADADLLWTAIAARDTENQIAFRDGQRYAARLVPAGEGAGGVQGVELTITSRGILENLQLRPIERKSPGAGEVEIQVAATGLNFRDVLNALGMYPGDPGALGNECVGTVVRVGDGVADLKPGDSVVALTTGAFRSFVTTAAQGVAPRPANLTAAEAATVPIVFMTAVYALNHLAKLSPGQRVLIHAGAGGVGLAAIQVAQRAGADIIATAGSDEKRAFLRSLGVRHVFNSRSLDFADEIAQLTAGEGVHVVLNSLNGEFIPASMRTLAPGGAFLELGKAGIWTPEQAAGFRTDISYHAIYLGDLDSGVLGAMLRELVREFERGTYRPLPHTTFPMDDAVAAFRYMAQAKHIGKVIVEHATAAAADAAAPAVRPDATYLITGGMGGLGLRVAQWLVSRGARHLALVGRSEPSEEARAIIDSLRAQDATVTILQGDVAIADDVRRTIDAIDRDMPPLRGVFHAAGVLDDGVLLQQDWSRFVRALAPKAIGAWHLHTQTLGRPIDFFVLFSSASALIGAPGQANYAAANAFLDGLAHHRRARGLAALSVNWGPWSDVGMAAAAARQDQRRWAKAGLSFIPSEEAVNLLERFVSESRTHVGVLRVDRRKAAMAFAGESTAQRPATTAAAGSPQEGAMRRGTDLVQQVKALPGARQRQAVFAAVREQVAQVLDLDRGFTLAPNQGLRDIGMDSLMAVELRNRLQTLVGRSLPATLAFDFPTVEALTTFILDKVVGTVTAEPQVVAEPAAGDRRAVAHEDPIAIVGVACRFPGGANSPETFWRMLREGVDAISEVPPDRWDINEYYDPDPDAPGKMYTRDGGFISDVDRFDARFFGISPREAVTMDPQQRLLLEVSWEALEQAGQAPDRLSGSRTGVFVGISSADYAQIQMKDADPARIDAYFGTGNSSSVAAGRLSYTLGLQGPAMSIDTACSSSLVAIHLACQSLRNGESRMALAGGVNLILAPDATINFSRARMLAVDGRCKTFDAAADGYVRGEGAGMVVLKRLSDAVADGDRVLAVIRGSAVNQDGRSSGLTVPNGPAQQALIREALVAAHVDPADVSYVEAHGTGTSLGDPIEMQALASALGEGRPADRPLTVGSVKTNFGHLEAAAGVAGLIKVVLSLQHDEIPPHLHFETLNPHIELGGFPAVIPTAVMPWPRTSAPRIAGVSAFGFSGTNAHIVVEEAPSAEAAASEERPLHPIVLSAKSESALQEAAARLADAIRNDALPLGDLAYTLNAGRAHLPHRAAFVARSHRDLQEGLDRISSGEVAAGIRRGFAEGVEHPEVVFVFTGNQSQTTRVARELYESQPTFRREFDRAAALVDVQSPGGAAFAVQYALARLWQSWGVEPAAVMGFDGGEFAAACVAGVLDAETAAKLMASAGTPACAPLVGTIAFGPPRVPMVSHVHGEFATRDEIAAPAFWQHPPGTASVTEGIATLWAASYRCFVEVGHARVADAARAIVRGDAALWLRSVSADRSDWEQMLDTLTALHVAGVGIDWTGVDRDYARHKVALPTYPFQRQRYWIETGTSVRVKPAAVEDVVKAGARQSLEAPLDLAVHTYADKWRALDRLTDAYLVQALRELGAFTRPHERHRAEDLCERLRIAAAYRPLVRRWLARLASAGLLVRTEDGAFQSAGVLPVPDFDSVWAAADALSDVPALAEYVRRCGTSLKDVVTGRRRPLETLFPDGSLATAEGLFEEAASARYVNAIIRSVTATFVASRRVPRVLEIGAGTGATTESVLAAVANDRLNYWFTDIYDPFLARATSRFAGRNVRVTKFDVDADPVRQGLPRGGFDVVIATNVMHASRNLRSALEHARDLLAPGGLFVLAENTTHHAFFDMTTALVEGWERLEPELRGNDPLPNGETWEQALTAVGFEHTAAFPGQGSPAGVLGQHVFVAWAPAASTGAADADSEAASAAAAAGQAEDGFLARLSDALESERDEMLVDYIRQQVVGVLRLSPDDAPDRRSRLMDLGLDSLMAVELRNRLAAGLGGIDLPATLMFDYPTIERMATYLAQRLAPPVEGAAQAAPETVPSSSSAAGSPPDLAAAAAKIAELSEEEAEALLIEKLERI